MLLFLFIVLFHYPLGFFHYGSGKVFSTFSFFHFFCFQLCLPYNCLTAPQIHSMQTKGSFCGLSCSSKVALYTPVTISTTSLSLCPQAELAKAVRAHLCSHGATVPRAAGTGLEIKNYVPFHKPKLHEYTSRKLRAVIDLNPRYFFPLPSGFSLPVFDFTPRYLPTSLLQECESFFLMRAKDSLLVTLLCHILIFNLTLLINVIIIVLPFPAPQWVWWLETLSSVSNTGPQKLPHLQALPSFTAGAWPFKIPRDMWFRDNAESLVSFIGLNMQSIPPLSC